MIILFILHTHTFTIYTCKQHFPPSFLPSTSLPTQALTQDNTSRFLTLPHNLHPLNPTTNQPKVDLTPPPTPARFQHYLLIWKLTAGSPSNCWEPASHTIPCIAKASGTAHPQSWKESEPSSRSISPNAYEQRSNHLAGMCQHLA